MNNNELAESLAAAHGLTKANARQLVDDVFSTIVAAAAQGEEVSLTGFGKFKVKATPAREGRNPATGATRQGGEGPSLGLIASGSGRGLPRPLHPNSTVSQTGRAGRTVMQAGQAPASTAAQTRFGARLSLAAIWPNDPAARLSSSPRAGTAASIAPPGPRVHGGMAPSAAQPARTCPDPCRHPMPRCMTPSFWVRARLA